MINLKEIKDLQKKGEFKKAKKLYLEILEKDTNNFEVLALLGATLLAEDLSELIESIKEDFKPSIAFERESMLEENSADPNLTFTAIFSTALTISEVNSDSGCNDISLDIIVSLELRHISASKTQSSDYC